MQQQNNVCQSHNHYVAKNLRGSWKTSQKTRMPRNVLSIKHQKKKTTYATNIKTTPATKDEIETIQTQNRQRSMRADGCRRSVFCVDLIGFIAATMIGPFPV
jgi:hypothetical protein